jgi:hypothetical protein
MTLSTCLSIAGPVLAALGAFLLAYDAFQGPMRAHIQRHFQTRAKALADYHRWSATTYPSPPYSAEEVAAASEERRKVLERLQAESAESELTHRLLVSRLAGWGFILVAVGSLMQAIGTYMAS